MSYYVNVIPLSLKESSLPFNQDPIQQTPYTIILKVLTTATKLHLPIENTIPSRHKNLQHRWIFLLKLQCNRRIYTIWNIRTENQMQWLDNWWKTYYQSNSAGVRSTPFRMMIVFDVSMYPTLWCITCNAFLVQSAHPS